MSWGQVSYKHRHHFPGAVRNRSLNALYTHTRTRTHARTHARARKHTHCCLYCPLIPIPNDGTVWGLFNSYAYSICFSCRRILVPLNAYLFLWAREIKCPRVYVRERKCKCKRVKLTRFSPYLWLRCRVASHQIKARAGRINVPPPSLPLPLPAPHFSAPTSPCFLLSFLFFFLLLFFPGPRLVAGGRASRWWRRSLVSPRHTHTQKKISLLHFRTKLRVRSARRVLNPAFLRSLPRAIRFFLAFSSSPTGCSRLLPLSYQVVSLSLSLSLQLDLSSSPLPPPTCSARTRTR